MYKNGGDILDIIWNFKARAFLSIAENMKTLYNPTATCAYSVVVIVWFEFHGLLFYIGCV